MNNTGSATGQMSVFHSSNTMTANVNVPQREIDAAMGDVGDEINKLAHIIGELEDRLRAVITPQLSQGCADSPVAAKYTCPLASSIHSNADYIKNNRERLENLLANLQL